MSQWKWRLWIYGLARQDEGEYITDMGPKTFTVWRKLWKRLYVRWAYNEHHGNYWNEVPEIWK